MAATALLLPDAVAGSAEQVQLHQIQLQQHDSSLTLRHPTGINASVEKAQHFHSTSRCSLHVPPLLLGPFHFAQLLHVLAVLLVHRAANSNLAPLRFGYQFSLWKISERKRKTFSRKRRACSMIFENCAAVPSNVRTLRVGIAHPFAQTSHVACSFLVGRKCCMDCKNVWVWKVGACNASFPYLENLYCITNKSRSHFCTCKDAAFHADFL